MKWRDEKFRSTKIVFRARYLFVCLFVCLFACLFVCLCSFVCVFVYFRGKLFGVLLSCSPLLVCFARLLFSLALAGLLLLLPCSACSACFAYLACFACCACFACFCWLVFAGGLLAYLLGNLPAYLPILSRLPVCFHHVNDRTQLFADRAFSCHDLEPNTSLILDFCTNIFLLQLYLPPVG